MKGITILNNGKVARLDINDIKNIRKDLDLKNSNYQKDDTIFLESGISAYLGYNLKVINPEYNIYELIKY